METFTIENQTNNITAHPSAKEAESVANSERFHTEASLVKFARNWPAARLVDIWNTFPGQTPARKFKDRATAVSRIWKAVHSLDTPAARGESDLIPEAPHVVPAREGSKVSRI